MDTLQHATDAAAVGLTIGVVVFTITFVMLNIWRKKNQ